MQSLIPQLPLLEKLLDGLIGSCGMEKSFLFDVVSKIYVATDSNPVDMQTYELCSDMIDVVIDVSCIYGLKPQEQLLAEAEAGNDQEAYDADSASVIKLSNNYILYLREVNKSVRARRLGERGVRDAGQRQAHLRVQRQWRPLVNGTKGSSTLFGVVCLISLLSCAGVSPLCV